MTERGGRWWWVLTGGVVVVYRPCLLLCDCVDLRLKTGVLLVVAVV